MTEPSAEPAEPRYEWKITVSNDLSRGVQRLLTFALLRPGVTAFGALFGVGMVLVGVPIVVAVYLAGATTMVGLVFFGLDSVLGTPVTFGLALAVVLGVLGGGGYLLGRLLASGLSGVAAGDTVRWERMPHLFGRLRLWAAVLSLVPIGALAYSLTALARLDAASFKGDVGSETAWTGYFSDQVVNGALLGLPAAAGRHSDIEPVGWSARVLAFLFRACLLNGFFWLIFSLFHLIRKPASERFTGTVAELADHLPHVAYVPRYGLEYPVELSEPTGGPVVVRLGQDNEKEGVIVRLECLGLAGELPGGARAFYQSVDETLRSRRATG